MFRILWLLLILIAPLPCLAETRRPLVIAHRGASGYLPEHTLASKAMAYAMGADYLEQDVVLTKDDQPVVFHDIYLDTVTDVASVFPKRKRPDGRYYVIDFSLDEIRTLRVVERIDRKTGKRVYPRRFPVSRSRFAAPTLGEEIELIQGLNKSTGRAPVGVYSEIKSPAWHRKQGKDISRIVLKTLADYGYRDKTHRVYVQCFDPAETKRIRRELKSRVKLVQLIGKNSWKDAVTDYDQLRTPQGLKEIATYADGIGPELSHVVSGAAQDGKLQISNLVKIAHQLGLEVHPYTFRADALPKYVDNFEELLRVFLNDVKVDGGFTDFPDLMVKFRDR